MAYALARGVSFCEIDDRFVFLDLIGDRYLCLDQTADTAFRALMVAASNPSVSPIDGDQLVALGLLRRLPGLGRIGPCPAPPAVTRELLTGYAKAPFGQLIAAGAWFLTAKARLKMGGLNAVISPLAARKHRITSLAAPPESLDAIVATFDRLDQWLTPHDQCVARSVAILRCCLAARIDATLVIGVALRPFAAHCWVQHGDAVLAEQRDTVRLYRPILSV